MQDVPYVGKGLNQFVFPCCLSFMVLLTITDGYNRIARLFGRKTSYLGTKDSYTSEKMMEGKFVADRFRKDKLSENGYFKAKTSQ